MPTIGGVCRGLLAAGRTRLLGALPCSSGSMIVLIAALDHRVPR
ncbi:hypothetical protein [Nocardia amamiensis]|nr:hypothetical protein [Nocardia amamiensis]